MSVPVRVKKLMRTRSLFWGFRSEKSTTCVVPADGVDPVHPTRLASTLYSGADEAEAGLSPIEMPISSAPKWLNAARPVAAPVPSAWSAIRYEGAAVPASSLCLEVKPDGSVGVAVVL